jgi:DNA-binding CsgD family transcriptional regulator/tetratricopeptide (TPR) repeat protein
VAQPATDSLSKFSPEEQVKTLTEIEKDKSLNNSAGFQAKLDFLKTRYTYTYATTFNEKDWKFWGLKALSIAGKNEDEWLAQCCYKVLGDMFFAQRNFDTCIFYHLKSIEKAEVLGYRKKIVAGWKINASDPLYHTRNYREVIDLCLPALNTIDKKESDGIIAAWNVAGLSYMKLGKYDSSVYCYNQLITFAKSINSGVWIGIATGNIGDVLYLQNRERDALPYWQKDIDSSIKYGEGDNAFLSKAYINRYQFNSGQQKNALNELQYAFAQVRPGSVTTKMIVAKILADCFTQIGINDSADYYNKYYYIKTDSINQIISRNNYSLVRLRLDFDKKNNEVVMVKKERRTEILRRNFLLGLLIVAVIIGLLFYNRQRLKIKLARKQNELARAEMDAARQQLVLFTDTLLEKNEQIEKLTLSLQGQNEANTDELVHQTLLTEDDWNRFKDLFEKTHPGFFDKMKEKAPGITAAEIRLAALVKLGLDNKQMASMQGISLGGVRSTKARLRQKMNLSGSEDLEQILLSV